MDIPSLPVRCLVSRLCEQRRLRTLECRCPVRVPITCNILYNLIFWEINMCRRRGELSLMSCPALSVSSFPSRAGRSMLRPTAVPECASRLRCALVSRRASRAKARRGDGVVHLSRLGVRTSSGGLSNRLSTIIAQPERTGRAANRNQTRTDALRLHQTETEQSHDMPHTCSARQAGRGRLTRCTF